MQRYVLVFLEVGFKISLKNNNFDPNYYFVVYRTSFKNYVGTQNLLGIGIVVKRETDTYKNKLIHYKVIILKLVRIKFHLSYTVYALLKINLPLCN